MTISGKAATVTSITAKGVTLQPSKKGSEPLVVTLKDAEKLTGLGQFEVVEV